MVLAAITVTVLVPFAGKAFHIDEPLYLWSAKHIHESPLDPYGFTKNWTGPYRPMWAINQNPPLLPYYIAAVALLFGFGETALHISMILPAVAVVTGTYMLARRYTSMPFEAALLTLIAPVFMVSGAMVMCDMFMLSFWIWAVNFWLKGIDEGRHGFLALSAVFISLAFLSKYFGVTLIPLLAAYTLYKKKSIGTWGLYLLIPILTIITYQYVTYVQYGSGLFSRTFLLTASHKDRFTMNHLRYIAGLSFTGGCMATALFYAPYIWKKKEILSSGIAACIVTILFCILAPKTNLYPLPCSTNAVLYILFAMFVFTAIEILRHAAGEFFRDKNPLSFLLMLWITGTFVFATFLNWTISARVILPMLPAVSILIMTMVQTRGGSGIKQRLAAIVLGLVLSLSVSAADTSYANIARDAAAHVKERYTSPHVTIWFDGHWGFQYYMESYGFRPLDVHPDSTLNKWDLIVVPDFRTNALMNPEALKPGLINYVDKFEYQPSFRWISTMNRKYGANFYTSYYGPLPFTFAGVSPVEYKVYVVTEPFSLN